ncbi:MAG: transposase, partial [Bacteroidota bacterium]|nr:transposase [Bacteroidota bacterium]
MNSSRQNDTLEYNFNLTTYFTKPQSQRQKQYEAIRAIILEQESIKNVAKRFQYKVSALYSLLRDVKLGKIKLFPTIPKGPQRRRTNETIQDKIINYRKQNLSTPDIQSCLSKEGINVSARTAERILKDSGFARLKRRTHKELGKTHKNQIISQRSENLDFSELKPFNIDCPTAGIFFFIPYILESNVLDIVKKCNLPESSDIDSRSAALSMLLFKLIGQQRLSHIGAYDQEPGLGIFAGLNVLPKATYMSTYSCRCSEIQLMELQKKAVSSFKKKYPHFYDGKFINLDFHSIPHYGTESEMQKLWCGAKHQNLKGANTVFAQDSQNNTILYSRADILRSEEAEEIKKFIAYWKDVKGDMNETLVFDCKFTKYTILDEITDDHIKFITLRKRHARLIEEALNLPKKSWKKIYLPIPKRKYKHVSVYEQKVTLKGCKNTFRQIIVKDHGRSTPTFVIINDKDLHVEKVLEVYAKRWHVENKLSELI